MSGEPDDLAARRAERARTGRTFLNPDWEPTDEEWREFSAGMQKWIDAGGYNRLPEPIGRGVEADDD